MLVGSREWIGENSFLEIASSFLDVNIYVFVTKMQPIGKKGPAKIVDLHPSARFSAECDTLYKHSKSIVLLTLDEIRYYVVTKNGTSIFDSSNDLIKTIHAQVCKK